MNGRRLDGAVRVVQALVGEHVLGVDALRVEDDELAVARLAVRPGHTRSQGVRGEVGASSEWPVRCQGRWGGALTKEGQS